MDPTTNTPTPNEAPAAPVPEAAPEAPTAPTAPAPEAPVMKTNSPDKISKLIFFKAKLFLYFFVTDLN